MALPVSSTAGVTSVPHRMTAILMSSPCIAKSLPTQILRKEKCKRFRDIYWHCTLSVYAPSARPKATMTVAVGVRYRIHESTFGVQVSLWAECAGVFEILCIMIHGPIHVHSLVSISNLFHDSTAGNTYQTFSMIIVPEFNTLRLISGIGYITHPWE